MRANLEIDNYQFRTNSIIQYFTYALTPRKKEGIRYFLADQKNREAVATYTGQITKGSKKRLTRAISLLVQSSQQRQILNPVTNRMMSFKLNFVTLTMPPSEKSKDPKHCHKNLLEPFLRTARRKFNVTSYVWKCELTEQGNVHYHLTTDTFMHLTQIRDEWNKILNRSGMLEDFYKKHGHRNPNSTDVHKVYKIKNLEAYLIKYVSKEDKKGRTLNAKVWDCSTNLKKAKYFTIEGSHRLGLELERLEKEKVLSRYSGERFSIFKFQDFDIRQLMTKEQYTEYYLHLKAIRNESQGIFKSRGDSPGGLGRDHRKDLQTAI